MTLGNDNGTDGQTDRLTDRVRRNMQPPPREEGRIIKRVCILTVTQNTVTLTNSLHAGTRPQKAVHGACSCTILLP